VILAADTIDILLQIGIALTFVVFAAALLVARLTQNKDKTK